MGYCVAVGVLIAGAAVLAERAALDLGVATRRIWAVAMTLGLVFPIAGVVLRSSDLPEEALFAETAAFVSPVAGALIRSVDSLSTFDTPLLDAWTSVSALLIVGFLGASAFTAAGRRRWSRETVDGVPVLLSDEVGPGVVGVVRSRVVLPRWALAAAPRERAMMLRHEVEHLSGGDPQLVLFGTVLAMAMPWNLPLWFMLRRLRLAVEVDCDARVLGSGAADVGSYGHLLLAVGGRKGRQTWPMTAFSRPRSALEHRIDRMTRKRAPYARLRAAGVVAAVGALMASAWYLPQPVRAADSSRILAPCPVDLDAVDAEGHTDMASNARPNDALDGHGDPLPSRGDTWPAWS